MDDEHKRALEWQGQQARKTLKLFKEGKMGLVTKAEIDAIFEAPYLEELARLQRKKIKELKQSVRVLLAHADGTKKATAKQLERARWRLEH